MYLKIISLFILGFILNNSIVYGGDNQVKESIDKAAAIKIAVNHLVKKQMDSQYRLKNPKVQKEIWFKYQNGHIGWAKPKSPEKIIEIPVWVVGFRSKTMLQMKLLDVVVKASTGEIVNNE